jgi:hypothetical protein
MLHYLAFLKSTLANFGRTLAKLGDEWQRLFARLGRIVGHKGMQVSIAGLETDSVGH